MCVPWLTSPRRLVERSRLIRLAQWRYPLKKTKLFLATAYLAEKAFKKLSNNSNSFLTLFPFYQILSLGAGTEESSFA